jgi:hypothetical protein
MEPTIMDLDSAGKRTGIKKAEPFLKTPYKADFDGASLQATALRIVERAERRGILFGFPAARCLPKRHLFDPVRRAGKRVKDILIRKMEDVQLLGYRLACG